MFSGKLWELFLDSFPKILLPGLTMTIPLTAISFTLALIIAVAMALVQFANVPVLRRVARTYEPLLLYCEVGLIYLIFSTVLTRLQALGERKLRLPGQKGV